MKIDPLAVVRSALATLQSAVEQPLPFDVLDPPLLDDKQRRRELVEKCRQWYGRVHWAYGWSETDDDNFKPAGSLLGELHPNKLEPHLSPLALLRKPPAAIYRPCAECYGLPPWSGFGGFEMKYSDGAAHEKVMNALNAARDFVEWAQNELTRFDNAKRPRIEVGGPHGKGRWSVTIVIRGLHRVVEYKGKPGVTAKLVNILADLARQPHIAKIGNMDFTRLCTAIPELKAYVMPHPMGVKSRGYVLTDNMRGQITLNDPDVKKLERLK